MPPSSRGEAAAILPGSRVIVFDHQLYRDDASTPPAETMRRATVLRRYGMVSPALGIRYPDLVDVRFDHRPDRESCGHFTSGVEPMEVPHAD